MSRYTKEHYEDVARILRETVTDPPPMRTAKETAIDFALDFADLFAADNPPSSRCWNCGDSKVALERICTRPNEGHRFGGFNRKQFLEACGLEPKQ